MKTEALFYRGAGGVEVLQFGVLELAPVGAEEVLVRVAGMGLNRADILQRKGLYPAPRGAIADVPGLEYSGVIDMVGAEVTTFQPGQRVMGIVSAAAMARHVVVPASCLLAVPASLDLVVAAALPEAYVTAYDAMILQGGLRATESVLIHSVAGGVGIAALQLAKQWGAFVLGTSRTASKLARCTDGGLDVAVHVVDGAFAEAVRRHCPAGVQVVLDTVGAAYLEENFRAIAQQGRMVVVGLLGGTRARLPLERLLSCRLCLRGTVLRGRPLPEKAELVARFATDVLPLFGTALNPVIDEVIAMRDVARAHQRIEANDTVGKIVLTW